MPPTSIAYFWGTPTSTVDWCEKNYEVSAYIAEYWNTLSNIPALILLPLFATFEIWRLGIERKFILLPLTNLLIGVGSVAFHMTLLYSMQLLDEISMMWYTMILIYFFAELPKPSRSPVNWQLLRFCVPYSIFFPVIYLLLKTPEILQIAFGLNALYVFFNNFRFLKENQFRCSSCNKLGIGAFLTVFCGFILWTIDNNFCPQLTHIRVQLPNGLSPFTQLHAIWHLFCGWGTYLQILFLIHARGHFIKSNINLKLTLLGSEMELAKQA